MKTRDDICRILNTHRDALLAEWPIEQLWLFGSVARNEQQPGSDVDLLVTFSKPMGWDFFDMTQALSALLNEKIDLIPKSAIKPRYWERIAPDVVEVFSRAKTVS